MRGPPVNPGLGPSIMSLLSSAELTALLEGNLPVDDRRNGIVEEDDYFFLETIIPSRKATRDYLAQGEADAED